MHERSGVDVAIHFHGVDQRAAVILPVRIDNHSHAECRVFRNRETRFQADDDGVLRPDRRQASRMGLLAWRQTRDRHVRDDAQADRLSRRERIAAITRSPRIFLRLPPLREVSQIGI
jgi:hypothetical protein